MIPVLFSIVSVIGLIAVVLGFIGFIRASRDATLSGGIALAGAVLGLLAMGLATWGLVLTISAMDDAERRTAIAAGDIASETEGDTIETTEEAAGGTGKKVTPQLERLVASAMASPTPSKAKEAESKKNSTQKIVPPGAVAKEPPFTLKVLTVDRQPSVEGSFETHKAQQGSYVIIQILVENIGNVPARFHGTESRLLNTDGKQYTVDTDVFITLNNGTYKEINPGQKVTRVLAFDVPKQAKPAVLVVRDVESLDGVLMALTTGETLTKQN